MKNRTGIVVLIVICAVLTAGLLWNTKRAHNATQQVTTFSNQWVTANVETEKFRQVNAELENDRTKQKEAFSSLTNLYKETSATLEKTETTLKAAQDDIAQKEAKISDLEAQNLALDQRALELSTSITNLSRQIFDTQQKLVAAEGDKSALTRELQKLMGEKAELERQFNDISVLKAQVAKLREEMNIARRLDWMRKGISLSNSKKGAEQMMELNQRSTATPEKPASKQPSYDLNVEIGSDGAVKVIPPLTNSAATPTPPPVR